MYKTIKKHNFRIIKQIIKNGLIMRNLVKCLSNLNYTSLFIEYNFKNRYKTAKQQLSEMFLEVSSYVGPT